MARTIVVFYLPSNELVYCELEDLAGKPVSGDGFVFEGAQYKAVRPTQTLGVFKSGGKRRTGLEKLCDLLEVAVGGDLMSLIAKIRNIGSGDQPESAGPVILPRKFTFDDFDHAILVRLELVAGRPATALSAATRLHAAIATEGDESVPTPVTAASAPPSIIVGEDAASAPSANTVRDDAASE